jgi:DNA-binding MarR family transcriptional regulator
MASSETPFFDRIRQGAAPMVVLSKPLTYLLLDLLGSGACLQSELLEVLAAARATCFRHLLELEELGVVSRWRRHGSRNVFCGLTDPAGRELFELSNLFLATFSSGHASPAATEASVGARGLAAAWNTTALRWLLAGPCSVRYLNTQAPPGIGLAEVEAARDAMLSAGLMAPVAGRRPRRFALTELGDRLGRPAAAAVGWHRRNLDGRGIPLAATDAETLVMLAARSLALPSELSGACELSVKGVGGVRVLIQRGESAQEEIAGDEDPPRSRLRGTVDVWLAAIVDRDASGLDVEGEGTLGPALLGALSSPDAR